jgi:hypothetical protein
MRAGGRCCALPADEHEAKTWMAATSAAMTRLVLSVMPVLVTGIYGLHARRRALLRLTRRRARSQDVDGRDKRGHDEIGWTAALIGYQAGAPRSPALF